MEGTSQTIRYHGDITSSFAIFTLTLSYIVSVIPIDLGALQLVVGIIAFWLR